MAGVTSGRGNEWQGLRVAGPPKYGNFWEVMIIFGKFCQFLTNFGSLCQLLATFANIRQLIVTSCKTTKTIKDSLLFCGCVF